MKKWFIYVYFFHFTLKNSNQHAINNKWQTILGLCENLKLFFHKKFNIRKWKRMSLKFIFRQFLLFFHIGQPKIPLAIILVFIYVFQQTRILSHTLCWQSHVLICLIVLLGTMDPRDFLAEAQIMKKLRHPKLIQV